MDLSSKPVGITCEFPWIMYSQAERAAMIQAHLAELSPKARRQFQAYLAESARETEVIDDAED